MVIRELLVKLGVLTDTKQVKAFDAAVEDVRGRLEGVAEAGKRVVAAAAAIGAGLAATAITTAQAAEAAQRQAEALRLGVEAAQEYTAVFEGVGADAKDVSDVFNTLADRSQDAQDGMQSFIDDFALVGVAVDDLRGREPEELFLRFADAIASTDDVVKRNAAAVRLLGDDVGNRLLPVLMQGSSGIAAMREEARRLGLVMSKEDVAAAKEAAVQFRAFDRVLTGLRNQVGLAVIPTMVRLVARLQDFIARNRDLARDKVEGVMDRFGGAAEKAEQALVSVNAFVEDNLAGWGNVFKRAQTALALFAGAKAWGLISSALVALKAGLATIAGVLGVSTGPALLFVAALVGMALTIDDIVTFLRGGESVIGTFLGQTEAGIALVEGFNMVLAQTGVLVEQLAPVFDFFAQRLELLALMGKVVGGVFVDALGFAFEAVARQITSFIRLAGQSLELINTIIAAIKGEAGVGDVFKEFMEQVGATVLALPGVGALTGGSPTSFIGNTMGAPVAPAVAPPPGAGGAGGGNALTQVTIHGNQTYLNSEVTPSQLEEMQRRGDLEQARQLRSIAGVGS